jgi:hypothetical protein
MTASVDTSAAGVERLAAMADAASHDERLADGMLYRNAAATLRALVAERDALLLQRTDMTNDVVLAGLAQEDALADRDRLAAECDALRKRLEDETIRADTNDTAFNAAMESYWQASRDRDRLAARVAELEGRCVTSWNTKAAQKAQCTTPTSWSEDTPPSPGTCHDR